jgi:hypothetical protein
MIDEKLEWQDENSMQKMRKQIAKVSTPKRNEDAVLSGFLVGRVGGWLEAERWAATQGLTPVRWWSCR